ncbi:MAG: helix-turn-helix domain-containing protein, partial [Cetobacterium sp.]
YRERAKLNKSAVANLVGISDSYYSRLEKGVKKALTIENLEKIREIFNLTDKEYEELIVSKFLPKDEKLRKIIKNFFKVD